MGDLTKIGRLLALISGILAIVSGVLHIVNGELSVLDVGTLNVIGDRLTGAIIEIVLGILLVIIYQGRIHISDLTVEAVVILIIGLFGGGGLAIIGAILILIDILFVSGNTRTKRR